MPTEPDGTAPFDLSFDFHDSSSCEWRLESFRDELSPDEDALLRPLIADLDLADTIRVIDELRQNCDDLLDTRLYDLTVGLRNCADYRCSCASDDWDCERSYFDEILDGLDTALTEPLWATQVGSSRSGSITSLSVDTLFELTGSHDGWERIRITWDGRLLDVSFSGYSCGTSHIEAVPLNAAQRAAYNEIEASYAGSDEDAWKLRNVPDALCEQVLDQLDSLEDDREVDICELLFGQHRDGALTEEQWAMFAGLLDEWEGTTQELLDASRLLSRDLVAA